MQKLQCNFCRGSLVMDDSGEFVKCESCGMKFKHETIKKMVGELGGPIQIEGLANPSNLLLRADQFRQLKNYEKAIEYYSRVLDIDISCSKAYWGQLLSELKYSGVENLIKSKENIQNNPLFKLAIQYADQSEAAEYLSVSQKISDDVISEMDRIAMGNTPFAELRGNISLYNFMCNISEILIEDEDYKDTMLKKEDYQICDNPLVIVIGSGEVEVSDVLPFLDFAIGNRKVPIIICSDISDELLTTLIINATRETLKSSVCLYKGNPRNLYTLAQKTGVRFYNSVHDIPKSPKLTHDAFGYTEKAILTNDRVMLVG